MSSIKNPLAAILDRNKFTGLNYQDYLRNLNIVLASEKLLYTLDKSPPKEAPADISPEELTKLNQCFAAGIARGLSTGFDDYCSPLILSGDSRCFRPLLWAFEVALDSSREALPSYTIHGGCCWLERDREVAVFGRVLRR
ncbi:hypothetical protein F511_27755 [Dorcoceras hygrometricum]|uniref:Uncharacterized protein n=1 Tax=Dorcoceras hygrometricum TaxID=472368 RepID=A0A2Z7BHI1_9LAMI|nr:hypothetical protein F511_27755 [Dorcoceras hygrometricum]